LKNLKYATSVRWIVTISIPFLLALGTLAILISWNSPSFPRWEYGRISPDKYGMKPEDRLRLAEANLEFLRHSEPASEAIILLEDLRMPGTDQSLFKEGELQHMEDVKELVDVFKWVGLILIFIVIAGLSLLLLKIETRNIGYRAIAGGGLLTASILLVLVVLILVSWNLVFTQFHEVLFPPGTWSFSYSDSLIRLFPEQFWFDFGLLWTGSIFVEGIALIAVGQWLQRRR